MRLISIHGDTVARGVPLLLPEVAFNANNSTLSYVDKKAVSCCLACHEITASLFETIRRQSSLRIAYTPLTFATSEQGWYAAQPVVKAHLAEQASKNRFLFGVRHDRVNLV